MITQPLSEYLSEYLAYGGEITDQVRERLIKMASIVEEIELGHYMDIDDVNDYIETHSHTDMEYEIVRETADELESNNEHLLNEIEDLREQLKELEEARRDMAYERDLMT